MAETPGERPSIKERVTGAAERVGTRLQAWAKDRFGHDDVVAANLNTYEKIHNSLAGKPQEVFEKLRKPWELASKLGGLTSTAADVSLAPIWGAVGYTMGGLAGALTGTMGFELPVRFLGRLGGLNPNRVDRVARAGTESIAVSTGLYSAVKTADYGLQLRPYRRLQRKSAEIVGKVVPKAIETAGAVQDRVSGVMDRFRNTWKKPPEQPAVKQVLVGSSRAK